MVLQKSVYETNLILFTEFQKLTCVEPENYKYIKKGEKIHEEEFLLKTTLMKAFVYVIIIPILRAFT